VKPEEFAQLRAETRSRREQYRKMMADRSSEYWQAPHAEGHQAVYRSLVRREEAYDIMEQMERERRST
jgi:hypothetical protein